MNALHEAGFINLLRTLAWIIFVFYAVRFIIRLFAPYLMKKAAEKIKEKTAQHFEKERYKYEEDIKEGEIIIDKKPKQMKESNKDVGEYVDFEEID